MITRIVLIGYRCVGKTTVGRCLAESYGFDFIDTDDEIARLKKETVRRIVAREGWAEFRRVEGTVLAGLERAEKMIVATGGGAIMQDPGVWKKIAAGSCIIWLSADVDVLCRRLASDHVTASQRPSLTGRAVDDEIVQVLQERRPLYRDLADLVIDTGVLTVHEIVEKIQWYCDRLWLADEKN